MELTGKLFMVLAPQTGQGKNGGWKRQDFVVETTDQYPKKVCISAWGDKVDELASYKTGDMMKVFFDIQSREYNGKWYTDLKAWKLSKGEGGGYSGGDDFVPDKHYSDSAPAPEKSQNWDDDLPF